MPPPPPPKVALAPDLARLASTVWGGCMADAPSMACTSCREAGMHQSTGEVARGPLCAGPPRVGKWTAWFMANDGARVTTATPKVPPWATQACLPPPLWILMSSCVRSPLRH